MENSIKEDIKDIEKYISFTSKRENFSHDTDWNWNKELANKIEHILTDYKRVLKENEELKEDRKNNNEMIALAQNEILNYMSGYEEGKKHKMTAVAQVVENQQYYRVRKQMEKYEELIKRLQKENELAKKQVEYDKTHICTPQIIKLNYIPVQKVKDKIEEVQKEYNKLDKQVDEYINDANKDLSKYYENKEKIGTMQTLAWVIDNLQELLEGRK
jgi:hypothetical protein|nr:MAG TPA: hypothetical protein [Caudoviricetes sp.]